MENRLYYWLALNFIPGIGKVTYKRLIERFQTPQEVFRASPNQLAEVNGMNPKTIDALRNFPKKRVETELKLIEKYEVVLLTLEDPLYPSNLLNIYDPPPLIYVKGEIKKEDNFAVAVVGSRHPLTYGRSITQRISGELAENGVTVVSGLARGIDTSAHRGALSAGGRTIAVLGCGIDIIYPPENKELARAITKKGAIISEFPFSTPPLGTNFPPRNRIISGLSLGVVIVEAGKRSGSLITARFALEQGREVFAVPGDVSSPQSKGTNQLIKEGAKLVENASDILCEISLQLEEPLEKEKETQKDFGLSGQDLAIISVLGERPLDIDTIIQKTNLKANLVSSILLELELKGLIQQLPGKMFIRSN